MSAPYSVLLIDRPEHNAFALGWTPDTAMPGNISPGVICVFTGFLDHILAQQVDGASREETATAQSKQLAVLLAHELSHLVLGHTLEAYANSMLLWPYLQRMVVDGARSLLYPLTALLGPFVGDS
jgi:Zn-dependent protease with chaperone function